MNKSFKLLLNSLKEEAASHVERRVASSDSKPRSDSRREEKKDGEDSLELTEQELHDNKKWQMRFINDEVFTREYDPTWWEKKEMDSIIEFLELKNPLDHPEFLSKPTQEGTKKVISPIFFPGKEERKSVLLKRGAVLLDGEERELMLFTGGITFSRLEVDSLVNLLLDASSEGQTKQLTYEQLCERFSSIDADGSGSLDRCEIGDFFRSVGMTLDDTVIDKLMNRIDADCDGEITIDEFESAMLGIEDKGSGKGRSILSSWASFFEALTNDSDKQKLDVAFQMSEIDTIVDMHGTAGTELGPLTFAVYLKGGNAPLLVKCTKPGHVGAWEEAFSKCIQMDAANGVQSDKASTNSNAAFWEESGVDWGD